jgi:hypothetical protein
MTDIPSTPADGTIRTVICTAIADTTAPDVDELNAGTTKDISCYLVPGGFDLGMDQATTADERECSTDVFGQPGRKTPSLSITGIDNTNSANEATYNDLVDILTEGTQLYAVRRRGVAYDTAWAVDDTVTVIPFKPGEKQEVAAEANSVTRSMWPCFVTGAVQTDVAVVDES